MTEKFILIFKKIILLNGPLGILFGPWAGAFFVILPTEVVLITAGSMTTNWQTLFLYTIFAALGSYIGTTAFYFIGLKSRTYAYNFIDKFGKYLLIDKQKVENAEEKFNEKGISFIFWGRFIPAVKSVISIPAGISRMDFKIYTLYSLLGSYIWDSLMLITGFLLKTQIELAFSTVSKYEKIFLILLGIIAIIYLFKLLIINRISKRNVSKE